MTTEYIKPPQFIKYDKFNPGNHLKTSNYNYFIQYDKDNIIGYNFLYKSILRIPADAFSLVDQFLRNLTSELDGLEETNANLLRIPSQWVETLIDVNFLIDKSIDELNLIKFRYFRSLYANDTLSLLILPTLWCNLACPYCYEFKKPIFMKPEVEDVLINWIEKNFKYKRYIHVSWFGGEPLLAKSTIFSLTKRLQKFCNSTNATYRASLTTNGYFLDKEFINSISSLNIGQVQVTMDGDKAAHDSLKRKRNGGGSFDRIFQNIIALCEKVPDCNLVLRVNCCDSNYDSIEQLLRRFPLLVRSHATIFFRWVYTNKACGYREFSICKKGNEPFNNLAKLYAVAKALNWKTMVASNSNFYGYCEVDSLDHYIIDPESNVFLCSHTFEKSESIGCLLEGESIRSNAVGNFTKWYSMNPFNDTMCVTCQLLPICFGGCRKARVEGNRSCLEEKTSLDLFVKSLVEERLPRSAGDISYDKIEKGGDMHGSE